MKFCPNCGMPLEGKLKCECGYDTVTGEVDETVYEAFKENEKTMYDLSGDNLGMMSGMNQFDVITGARMMGIDPDLSDEQIRAQMNRIIFNKDNDNLQSEDLAELMKTHKNQITEIEQAKKLVDKDNDD